MVIQQISKQEALSFFGKYEHLGNCGLGVWHYGAYQDNELLSVVSFGPTSFNPQRSSLAKIAKQNNLKIIQLTRGGTRFDAPRNTASQAVSLALKEVKKRFGNVLVIAYSDTKWNEIGTIYQSTNFLYLGQTNPKGQANYVINGRKMSGWTVRKKYMTRDFSKLLEIDEKAQKIQLTPKHIYVYISASKIVGQKVRKSLFPLSKEYPKRNDYKIGSMTEIWKSKNLLCE